MAMPGEIDGDVGDDSERKRLLEEQERQRREREELEKRHNEPTGGTGPRSPGESIQGAG
jgi:hypothetical protein